MYIVYILPRVHSKLFSNQVKLLLLPILNKYCIVEHPVASQYGWIKIAFRNAMSFLRIKSVQIFLSRFLPYLSQRFNIYKVQSIDVKI